MTDVIPFGAIILGTATVGLLAVFSSLLSRRVGIPAPGLFLAGAAIVVAVLPDLHAPSAVLVGRLVTVALAVILFEGGLSLGRATVRASAGPIGVLGLAGTFLTAAAAALLAHQVLRVDWYLALLVGTAVAPTDPAVVFSVLGRGLSGRADAIVKGESGVNDPVGIALLASLLAAGGVGAGAFGQLVWQFAAQLVIGGVVGVVGGHVLLWLSRRVSLPSEALYPLRTLAGAMVLFGLATVAHGSGFLAVFAAGIVLGDAQAPHRQDVERFHSTLASLAEIVAFLALGLTVDLTVLARADVWLAGLALAAGVAFVIRPVVVGLCLWRTSLPRNERAFIAFAGLKGAVPILLGSFLLAAQVPDAPRLYGVVVVVVAFSVAVQGSLVPPVARRLRLAAG